MDTPPAPPEIPAAQPPTRHGCLTAWLVFMIIANAFAAIATALSIAKLKAAGLTPNYVVIGLITLCAVANIIFAVMLLRWKKFGFFGFCVTSVIALALNLSIGVSIVQSALGLLGIAILYWVLNMGEEEKAWPRLK